jgi:fatty acid desaturase
MFWYLQHVVQHHVYTNDKGDVDLIHLSPLGRLSPSARWKWIHSFNVVWALVFLPIVTTLSETIQYPVRLWLAYCRGTLSGQKVLRGCSDKETFLFSSLKKRVLFLLAMAIPIVLYAYMYGAFGFRVAVAPWVTTGIYFFLVTQVSHLQEECQDSFLEDVDESTGKKAMSWSIRQVMHTVDYNSSSTITNLLTGGLNTQSIHHLFPSIHHAHYIALGPILEPIIARHLEAEGLVAPARSSFLHAFLSWITWMNKLGRSDV